MYSGPYRGGVGGDSVAKLTSGSKLWIIATSFHLLYDFYTFKGTHRRGMEISRMENHLHFHVAEPLNFIVKPSFAVHADITEPTFNRGKPVWAVVTGSEALAKKDSTTIRGRCVMKDFCLDVRRGQIVQEMRLFSELELLRPLKTNGYRNSIKGSPEGWELPSFIAESSVTTRITVLLCGGYPLKKSLVEITPRVVKKPNFRSKEVATIFMLQSIQS